MAPKIQILVSCHKESYVPKSSVIHSIQTGTALSDHRISAAFYDDQGENISARNKSCCELTAQYWAWKNVEADYYGFFHYRRYLLFEKAFPVMKNGKLSCCRWRPYVEREDIKKELCASEISYERIAGLVEKYDIITTLREPMDITVYEHYCQFHNKSDLDRMLKILLRRHPEYRQAAAAYLQANLHYFTNMYLMSKKEFFSYMEWLFPMLDEFEQQTDFYRYNEREYRVTGFLAERLFGIYYTHACRKRKKNCCELQYAIFRNTAPWCRVTPVFGQKNVNIAIAAENNYAPYAAVLLQSIMDCADPERNYDIVILHTQISIEYQQKMAAMARKGISIRFCDISDYIEGVRFSVHQHFTKETFYRYFLLEVLEGYQKVLYLDADMIVCQDVAALYDTQLKDYYVAAVRDIDVIGQCRIDRDMKQYIQKELRIKKTTNYFQAGVQLLNLTALRKHYTSMDFVRKTQERHWRLLDQDVMNMMCQGRVYYLRQEWNVLADWKHYGRTRMDILCQAPVWLYREYQKAHKRPNIIHYAGTWKPWRQPSGDFAAEFWNYARETPFYETILFENVAIQEHFKRKTGIRENRSIRYIRLGSAKLEITVDMKLVNRLLPPGSQRRIVIRRMFGKYL